MIADGCFVILRKLSQLRPFIKFVDGFLRQIQAATDVDRFEPALFAPAPEGAGRNANLFAPRIEADDRFGLIFRSHRCNHK